MNRPVEKSFEKIIVHIVHRPKLINIGLGICEGKKVFLCESCVRKVFQNVLNKTKLKKIWKMETPLNKGVSVFMRSLGNSEKSTLNQ